MLVSHGGWVGCTLESVCKVRTRSLTPVLLTSICNLYGVSFFTQALTSQTPSKGTAEIVQPSDRRYPELDAPLLGLTQGMFPIHSIFVVQVPLS